MAVTKLQFNQTIWMNIIDPTQQDLAVLQEAFPCIHPLNIEDISSNIERPKTDLEDTYVFAVFQVPRWDARLRLTRPCEIDVFVGQDFIVTAHDGSFKPLQRLYESATDNDERRAALLGKGAAHAFYVMVDAMVDYIFPILRKVDQNIRQLEERIFSDEGRIIIRQIAEIRRDIIALRRIVRQLVPVIESLDHSVHHVFKDDLEDYFDDIVDHMHRARDIVDENSEVITSLADTADKLLSHRINNVMRVLAVISVIMLPLTLITGMFGMNFSVIPLEDEPQAFLIITGVMLLIGFVMLTYFRNRRWL